MVILIFKINYIFTLKKKSLNNILQKSQEQILDFFYFNMLRCTCIEK